MTSKRPGKSGTKARRQAVEEVDDPATTSKTTRTKPTSQAKRAPSKKASRSASKRSSSKAPAKKRTRGRPRVSNTDTERVTLRIEKDSLEIIDTLVGLKQYSNRSDAIRAAIKAFCEDALDDVDDMLERHQKKVKLQQLKALQEQLAELNES